MSTAVPFAKATVVIAPMRRRIARPGEDVTFISDRAFRLTPGFRAVHRRAVVQGILDGGLQLADAQQEGFVAAVLAARYERAQRASVANGILKYGSWNPVVYSLLYSGTMPFYSETIGKAHPSDPVADGLLERLQPQTSSTVLAAQLTKRFGVDTVEDLGPRARRRRLLIARSVHDSSTRLRPMGGSLPRAGL